LGKLKVYELAKMMNLSNTEMLEKLNKMGIDAKSHLSTLEESDVEKVKGTSKKAVKEDKKQEQVHIIRRNVRVINTSEEGKDINEITTNAAGNIKKTHQNTSNKPVNNNNNTNSSNNNRNNNNSQNKNRNNSFDRRNRFQNNRSNIVITRNGKPVEKVETAAQEKPVEIPEKQEIKPEIKQEVKQEIKPEIKNEVKESVKNMEKNVTTVSKNNENTNVSRNVNNNRNNNYNNRNNRDNRENRDNRDNRDNNYRKNNNYNSQNNPNYNRNSNSRDNNKDYRKNNNFVRNDQNGERPQRNNFRRDQRQNSDNTSYQVNKFIKQAEKSVVEQKESREYSSVNIDRDKKKYNDKNSANLENKKEKIDKNKLREEHSRVSTGRLRGMEINQDGLMDLYERDSDLSRKSSGKKKSKTQKVEMKQTKIIPMTEVKLPETMTVKEFAEAIKKQASEVIKKLFSMGIMATVNQDIDFDTAYLIAGEFGITAEKEVVVTEEDILFDESEDKEEDLVPRPPIVVVMGHVDHGKTSLLDRLRKTNVVEGEAGGITQHIGAYKVKVKDREVCFLDTPGHEAFTAMRARGAQITDIAIIIVAADDGIKPQTVEAIDHAKAAGVSILVAINKIDKPGANVERVKQELLEHDLVPEEWGGDTICVPISARTGEGIDNLLEMLLLIADMKDLKANPNKQAKGTVIEARLDKTKGTIVSMLVQRGELNVGDTIVVGDMVSKIRAMKDDKDYLMFLKQVMCSMK
jgi:translation initiation factor IF-2